MSCLFVDMKHFNNCNLKKISINMKIRSNKNTNTTLYAFGVALLLAKCLIVMLCRTTKLAQRKLSSQELLPSRDDETNVPKGR
jgi:hypothetical protein